MAEHDEHAKSGSHGGGHGHGHGPPHGGGHEEGHEGAPEWLISFADNVALMMGFFVLLLAMNMKPANSGGPSDQPSENASAEENTAMLDWALSIREAFNNPVTVNSTNPDDRVLKRRLLQKVGKGEARESGQKGQHDSTTSIRPNSYYSMGGVVEFDQGSIEAGPAQREAAAEIARKLRGMNNVIEVHGHVSAKEADALPDEGMKLSSERAYTVATLLHEQGVEWGQMHVDGYGKADPVALKAYDAAAHRKNQRVEVLVTHRSATESTDDGKEATSPDAMPPAPDSHAALKPD